MIGEIFGNYRVTAKLGEGGMGAVYLAEHPNIGRKVAIKMIRPVFSNDAETLRRFVREARSTAGLRHPALVDIMDYGVHEKTGSAYIVMEYLEGESLDSRLERVGKIDPGKAAEIARQIALGMAAAHRAGIIHRDLKPGNVHLVADPDRPGIDVVKVLDFGIAKLANNDTGAGPTTRTDVLLGTPRYMAPEQCRGGGSLDHRADIYSLGCLLYEALCGRPPFAYQWPGELIVAHLSEAPVSPRALVPAIPGPLETIVMRALAKNPDHRQPTMSDVARELGQFLGLDVSVPPIAIGQSAAPAARSGFPLPPGQPSEGAAVGGAATTTASVVMRHRQANAAAQVPAVANDDPPARPFQGRSDTSQRVSASRSAALRRTLIGVGGLVTVGLVGLIATKRARNQATTETTDTALAVATASTEALAPSLAPSGANAGAVEFPSVGETAAPSIASGAEQKGAVAPADDAPDEQAALAASSTARSPAAPSPTALNAPEAIGSSIRIKVANARPGLRVTVDGRFASLPIRLPRDQKPHVLAFTAPNFKPETRTIVADQDHTLTLEYRPKLYVP